MFGKIREFVKAHNFSISKLNSSQSNSHNDQQGSLSITRITVLGIIAIILVVILCVVKAPPKEYWQAEDFNLYSEEGQHCDEPSIERPTLVMQGQASVASTFRGIKVGEDAKSALKKYNWKDFELVVFREGDMYGDYDLTNKYNSKIGNSKDLINSIDELTNNKYAIKLRIQVYKQKGRLITRSYLDGKDGFQPYQKLMYVFAMEVEDGKVHTIVTENNYLIELKRAYTINGGKVPDTEQYKWLRVLGE